MNKAKAKIRKSSTRRHQSVSYCVFLVSLLMLSSCNRGKPTENNQDKASDTKKPVILKTLPTSHTDKQVQQQNTQIVAQTQVPSLNKNLHVINAQRYAVQVYASQDANAAQTRAQKLSQLGYDAREVEAQVSDQGLWHRVVFGDWSTRMQAQIAGERYSRDNAARAICAEKDSKGAAFVIRDNVAPMEVNPRLAAALNKNSLGQKAQVALVQSNNDSEPVWVLLVVKGDNQIRLLDVIGGLHASWPLPQWTDCPNCKKVFSGKKPKNIKLQFADNLAPNQADFVLSEYHFGQNSAAQWTQIAAQGQGRASLSYPVRLETPEALIITRHKLIDADDDDGFEILLTQWRGTLHEGDLCDVQVSRRLFDPGAQGLVRMDRAYFKNLADQDLNKAQKSFDRGLEIATTEKSADQLLLALSGYGQSKASLTDLQRKQKLLDLLKKSPNDEAAIYQVLVLSKWIAVHPSQPAALASDVLDSLDRLLSNKRFGVPTRSCDASPLAHKGQWSNNNLAELVQKSDGAYDLRRLPVEFFATMAEAYDVDTPAGKRLDQLAKRLRPASAIYKKIRSQLDQAWSIGSTK